MFKQLSGTSGNVLGFKIGEDVTGEDIHDMGRIMSEAITVSGNIRLLIEIEGFRHMEHEALMEKFRFVTDHAREIEQMASLATGCGSNHV